MKLFKKTACRRPTLYGWLILLGFFGFAGYFIISHLAGFLTVNKPVKAQTMIIEGWLPDYALEHAIEIYKRDRYKHLIVTGIPLHQWKSIANYESMAEVTTHNIQKLGFHDTIFQASIPHNVLRDRTYSTALVSKMIFEEHPDWEKAFNIYSLGVHSRRSRLMFKKAFGEEYRIGIFAEKDISYDAKHWWRSSRGFRSVSSEIFSYIFVRLFFHPDPEQYISKIKKGLYVDSVMRHRAEVEKEFADTAATPLDSLYFQEHYAPPNYYPVKPEYRVKAHFTVDTTGEIFEMATNTSRKPRYRVYGYFDFKIHDTSLRLTAYRNVDFLDDPEYGQNLFVPFKDSSNGKTTYEAGRYIDVLIPHSDTVFLDFNKAYNPYCAYSERWSCPLVPFENWLEITIPAGEKKYFKNKSRH
jgi:hypothetical protein